MLELSKAFFFQSRAMILFRIFSIFLYLYQSIYCYSGLQNTSLSELFDNLPDISDLAELEILSSMKCESLPVIPLENLTFQKPTNSTTNAAPSFNAVNAVLSFNETIGLVTQAHDVLDHPLYSYPSAIKRSTEITTTPPTFITNKCQQCGNTFSRPRDLQIHEKYHDEREYSCKICKKPIEKYSSLLIHLLSWHSELFEVVCELHNSVFTNPKTLYGNIKKRHNKDETDVKTNFTYRRLNQS